LNTAMVRAFLSVPFNRLHRGTEHALNGVSC
jgi:hypothetical protein